MTATLAPEFDLHICDDHSCVNALTSLDECECRCAGTGHGIANRAANRYRDMPRMEDVALVLDRAEINARLARIDPDDMF